MAARRGNKKITEILINYGADLNLTNSLKQTALHKACIWNRLEVAEILIENKIDIEILDFIENPALVYACVLGIKEIVKLLVDNDSRVLDRIFHSIRKMGKRNKNEIIQILMRN